MRIISGLLKGRKINFLINSITRPLKDSVRENIFNIIKHSNLFKISVEKSSVLDLYSGTGSFGIECISRGATKVIFIEEDKQALIQLKKNLNSLSISNKTVIKEGKIENKILSNFKYKFNIFFFDPPFSDKDFLENLRILKDQNSFHQNHIVIIHRERKTKDNFKGLIKIILIKEYRRSKIIFGHFV